MGRVVRFEKCDLHEDHRPSRAVYQDNSKFCFECRKYTPPNGERLKDQDYSIINDLLVAISKIKAESSFDEADAKLQELFGEGLQKLIEAKINEIKI